MRSYPNATGQKIGVRPDIHRERNDNVAKKVEDLKLATGSSSEAGRFVDVSDNFRTPLNKKRHHFVSTFFVSGCRLYHLLSDADLVLSTVEKQRYHFCIECSSNNGHHLGDADLVPSMVEKQLHHFCIEFSSNNRHRLYGNADLVPSTVEKQLHYFPAVILVPRCRLHHVHGDVDLVAISVEKERHHLISIPVIASRSLDHVLGDRDVVIT
ncbi:hypothetical protein NKR23_g12521 [Pleurostoma richardsiae]|uniref:Uncharacterized protein n=1 Tax=Pleurostoma richardsiae TaxID=41990 RepID=A0AA38R167_9PEZI|nr:hypothetical protein NKR23_g12521 [Pleurostoma richardsiae]